MTKTGYIAGIARGHNAGVCLLKDGEVVFSIEEERLTRVKYDGGPLASILKIKEYTDKIDYLVIAHTQHIDEGPKIDYTGDSVYVAMARKLKLIDHKCNLHDHPQVIDLSYVHHKLHAAAAFYRSGFEKAVGVVIDGAGTFTQLAVKEKPAMFWETETIFSCEYPAKINTLYKHYGTREPIETAYIKRIPGSMFKEESSFDALITGNAGITKVYEAVTEYCGFSSIEAGKTMGLFPYGKENSNIPPLFETHSIMPTSNRNVIIPNYPQGAFVNFLQYAELESLPEGDPTLEQNRRDLAYACQKQTQEQALNVIKRAVEIADCKNVVLSGGYALNCVANYYYLSELNDMGVKLYVEPISNDAGTAMGAAMLAYHTMTEDKTNRGTTNLYLGPKYEYTHGEIRAIVGDENSITDASYEDVVTLLREKNIVAMFQGCSENGPRALGNRSILFDPTFKDGKDFVNKVKRREYFRPFAATVMKDHVHDWFDLRGMDESPSMMYAVNCKEGVEDKVPSVIHVDNTCRIQTVTEEQNKHFYNLIKTFNDQTGVPMLFNTSFNLGGDPLVETLEDAVDTLYRSDIEYLYLPEYGKLIKIANPTINIT